MTMMAQVPRPTTYSSLTQPGRQERGPRAPARDLGGEEAGASLASAWVHWDSRGRGWALPLLAGLELGRVRERGLDPSHSLIRPLIHSNNHPFSISCWELRPHSQKTRPQVRALVGETARYTSTSPRPRPRPGRAVL